MKRKNVTINRLLCLLAAIVFLLSFLLMQQRSQVVIRIHDDQVDLQKLTNAIAEFIIVNGYQHQVELVESTIKEARGLLLRGDIDITLELWRENNLLWHRKAIEENRITDLGEMYDGGKQYWIVSKWYARKHGIRTVFDMQHHWQDFLDPDDPSKGLFFNCIYGWTCRDINRVKLQAYGMDRYYNTVSPVSPNSLKSIYTNAQARGLPVFGYYWEPNSIMAGENWHILEEPAYAEEIWQQVIEAASTPNAEKLEQACSFNDSGAHKVVNSGLAEKAPGVFRMVKKMKIDTAFFNDAFLNNGNLDKKSFDPEKLARRFLLSHPEQWTSWVPPDVENKIDQALKIRDHNQP